MQLDSPEYNINFLGNEQDQLSIKIGEPSKVKDGRETYTVYPVQVNSVITAHHRYRDFDWLRNELNTKYPGCSTPALPEKEGVTSYWTNQDTLFFQFRRHGLEKFLQRISTHPKLSKSPDFISFLKDDELNFAIRVKNSDSNKGWYGYISTLGTTLASTVTNYISPEYSLNLDEGDFEFSSSKNEVNNIFLSQETLCQQGKSLITSEENEITSSLALAKAYENMSKVEKDSLSDKLKTLGETHNLLSETKKASIDKLKEIVGQLMEDNKRVTQGLLETLERRSKIKAEKNSGNFDLREIDSDIREEMKNFNSEKSFLSQTVSKELILYKQELSEKISEIWREAYNRISV